MTYNEIICRNDATLPYGLREAQRRFRSQEFERKRMTAAYMPECGSGAYTGENNHKTHPTAKRFGYLNSKVHAEFNAMNKAPRIENGTIYVYRERADGTTGLARPCTACQALLRHHGVTRMVYSTDDGYAVEKL